MKGFAMTEQPKDRSTAVLDVRGMQWASQQSRITAVLGRRPGVLQVDANPVAQTATVVFDPRATSLAQLPDWVRDCGFPCAGQSVPHHVCDPMADPDPPPTAPPRPPPHPPPTHTPHH